jgi:hypothetical protein
MIELVIYKTVAIKTILKNLNNQTIIPQEIQSLIF